MKTLEKILTLFISLGAVVGAVMMMADPAGETWGGAPLLGLLRAKMPWADLFFKDFIPSAVVLLLVNGFTQFAAAVMLLRGHRLAHRAVLGCSIVLLLWIALEWWVWGFNGMSNFFFLLALSELLASVHGIRCGT